MTTGQKLRIPNKEALAYIDGYMDYEPETGKLWKFYPTLQEFKLISGVNSNGYVRVYIKYKEYLGHHVAWYLYYGKWPIMELDHKNRVKNDNFIDNLREATDIQQTANLSSQSKYGRCIWYHKRISKYEVCIRTNGKRNYLGIFESVQEAVNARDKAESIGLQYELSL